MTDYKSFRRMDLIKALRKVNQAPNDILKYSKQELIQVCEQATGLDFSNVEPLGTPKKDKPIKPKTKNELKVKQEEVKPPKVVLNELSSDSDSSDDEQPIQPPQQPVKNPSRLLQRRKIEQTIVQPVQPVAQPKPVLQKPVNNKIHENTVRQLLKEYTSDVRKLLLNYDDGAEIDSYDEQQIIAEYNETRGIYESKIDDIIGTLQTDFTQAFYNQISKLLDQSLDKVQRFLGMN